MCSTSRYPSILVILFTLLALSSGVLAVEAQTGSRPEVIAGGTGTVTGLFNQTSNTWEYEVTSAGSADITIPTGGLPNGEKVIVNLDGFAVDVDTSKLESLSVTSDGLGGLNVTGAPESTTMVTTPQGVTVTITPVADSKTAITDKGTGLDPDVPTREPVTPAPVIEGVTVDLGGASVSIESHGVATSLKMADGSILTIPAGGNYTISLTVDATGYYAIVAGPDNPTAITMTDANGSVTSIEAGTTTNTSTCASGITPSGTGSPCA